MQAATRSRLTLSCILVTILLDMIGVGIIVPVLPELLEELTGGSVANAAVIGGYLVFAYAFMQFVFSPVLGNLSDRFGRRPVLLASLLGLTFDYLMMSIAPVVWYLFIGRIIAGIAGAAVATATAYMADITPPHKRTHRFGLIGAAFGLGFIIGPVIGGELGEFGPRVPFYAAAALAFANFLFGLLVLPESLPKASRRKFDIRRANPFGAIVALRQYPVVIWLLAVLFAFSLAAQALPTVFSYFTVEVFRFTSSNIGRALGAFGIGFAICQAFLVGPMVKRVGEPPVAILGLLAAIAAFAGVAFTDQVFYLYVFIMVGAVSGLAAPAINGVLSRQVPDNAQGELQGAVNAANSLATIIGPLAATQIFSYFTTAADSPGYFPGAPFLAASICVVGALALFTFAAWRFELGHRPSIANRPHVPDMPPPGQIRVPPIDEDEDGSDADQLATDADRAAILSIVAPVLSAGETYAIARDLDAGAVEAYWFGPTHEVFLAEEDGNILGSYYLMANQQGGGAHVANCGYMTAPAAQGKGVARAMCEHSLIRAKERGFRAMQFNHVVSTNTRAVALWQRLGFDIVGTLPKAFNHPIHGYVDSYVMFRAL